MKIHTCKSRGKQNKIYFYIVNYMSFSFFDDIVCISLDIAPERRKHAQYYFNNLNIPAKFHIVKKHAKGGMYGCFDSHIQILKDAYDRGLDNILVFEDDVMPTDSYSERLVSKAIEFMKSHNDWDIFYLGHTGSSMLLAECINTNIIKYNALQTHALCYHKRGIIKILQTYQAFIGKIPYDWYLVNTHMKQYCISPTIFDQNYGLEHHIQNIYIIDYLGRILYPIRKYIKYNYRISVIKYYMNVLYLKYNQYFTFLYLLCITISVMLLIVIESRNTKL